MVVDVAGSGSGHTTLSIIKVFTACPCTASQVKVVLSSVTERKPQKSLASGGGRVVLMVLGKLPVPGRPTIWITVGQGPTALVVGAGGGGLDVFTIIYHFLFSFSLSLEDGSI